MTVLNWDVMFGLLIVLQCTGTLSLCFYPPPHPVPYPITHPNIFITIGGEADSVTSQCLTSIVVILSNKRFPRFLGYLVAINREDKLLKFYNF